MSPIEILDAIEADIRHEMPHYQLLGRLTSYRKLWQAELEAEMAFTERLRQPSPAGTASGPLPEVPVQHTRSKRVGKAIP